MTILLATIRASVLAPFCMALKQALPNATLHVCETPEAVLAQIQHMPPALLVLDESLVQESLVTFITTVLQHNAFIHTALVSSKSEHDLHDAMEGMGLVDFLPLCPSAQQAEALINKVQTLGYIGQQ